MRHPPENSAQGRCWSLAEKPRPARIDAARAGAACAPISASRVWISAMRCGSCAVSASANSAVRSLCAFRTTSSKLSGPFGASCASLPMRQRGGISTWPCSADVSPAMTPNNVVLPVPLRPTSPTRAPVGTRAEAPFNSVRPAIRTVRSSMMSMPRLLADSAARSKANCGIRAPQQSPGRGVAEDVWQARSMESARRANRLPDPD